MNIKSTLSVRMLVVIGVTALIIALPVVALMQESAVAAPPPPLRGPFRFIEVPQGSAADTASSTVQWVPFYTQTFTFGGEFSGWTITRSTDIYVQPAPHKWGRVKTNFYPSQDFADTLWAAADPYPDLPVDWTVYANSTYTKTMDTWAIYPLDVQQFSRFKAEFWYWLDTQPGARFGWAFSCDGTNFYGSTTHSHDKQWRPMELTMAGCPGQINKPAYLAFYFQSSNTETPVGLGAFVDNLTISGTPWLKTYLPIIRRDPTPTAPPASPTPSYFLTRYYDFQDSNNRGWCGLSETDFGSISFQPAGSNVYMAVKAKGNNNLVMQSPRYTTPDDYSITARFGLLRFNSGLNLSDYSDAQFGLVFGVDGFTFDPTNCDVTTYSNLDGGFYRFLLQVHGSGYYVKLEKYNYGTWSAPFSGNLPSSITINRSDWNTLQLDRNGSGIVGYINGVQVFNLTDGTWTKGRFFGVFTEVFGNNSTSNNTAWESDWDNINIYDMTP